MFRKMGFQERHMVSCKDLRFDDHPVFAAIESTRGIMLMEADIRSQAGARRRGFCVHRTPTPCAVEAKGLRSSAPPPDDRKHQQGLRVNRRPVFRYVDDHLAGAL